MCYFSLRRKKAWSILMVGSKQMSQKQLPWARPNDPVVLRSRLSAGLKWSRERNEPVSKKVSLVVFLFLKRSCFNF